MKSCNINCKAYKFKTVEFNSVLSEDSISLGCYKMSYVNSYRGFEALWRLHVHLVKRETLGSRERNTETIDRSMDIYQSTPLNTVDDFNPQTNSLLYKTAVVVIR